MRTHDQYWKFEASKRHFLDTEGNNVGVNLDEWEKAIEVYEQNWYWALEWIVTGYPSPPLWFFKSKEARTKALLAEATK